MQSNSIATKTNEIDPEVWKELTREVRPSRGKLPRAVDVARASDPRMSIRASIDDSSDLSFIGSRMSVTSMLNDDKKLNVPIKTEPPQESTGDVIWPTSVQDLQDRSPFGWQDPPIVTTRLTHCAAMPPADGSANPANERTSEKLLCGPWTLRETQPRYHKRKRLELEKERQEEFVFRGQQWPESDSENHSNVNIDSISKKRKQSDQAQKRIISANLSERIRDLSRRIARSEKPMFQCSAQSFYWRLISIRLGFKEIGRMRNQSDKTVQEIDAEFLDLQGRVDQLLADVSATEDPSGEDPSGKNDLLRALSSIKNGIEERLNHK